MTIPELLDTLIIHPSGLIEMPMDTYERAATEYVGVTVSPKRIQNPPETDDLLIQEGF